jgi:metal-responsive CopG/Arc/MetJ family transcriptional regulator
MKTAISLQDELALEADRAARKMGISRSRLFSLALADFLRSRRRKEMLEKLNEVYGPERGPEERGKLAAMKQRFRSTIKDRW